MPAPLLLLLIATCLPLGSFLLLITAGRRMGTTISGVVGTVATLVSFTLSLVAMMHWLNGGMLAGSGWGAGAGTLRVLREWSHGATSYTIGLHVDSLTIVIVTVGLLVSSAIHVFTTGYLRNDVRGPRSFAFMSLCNAALVGFMTSASLPQWLAWTMVSSLAAWLLATPVPLGPGGLGITPVPRGLTGADLTQRASAAQAMLIVRCVGDAALIVLIAILSGTLPGMDFATLWGHFAEVPPIGAWLIVVAAVAYSSAFPASLFLPDAKGSPTPVAALAYAVTMLPAGILLTVRLYPLLSEVHLAAFSVIGTLTLLTAVIAAVMESDLRRILAWVTVAGVGSTFSGIGAGSFGGAVLHVVGQMFGLAILILAVGSILHACHGERRLAHYGGLLFRLPATALLLIHGAGTLLGGPFLASSGSWSTLLSHAYRSLQNSEWRGALAFTSLFIGLGLLAMVLSRAFAMAFLGRPRDRTVYAAARESATLSVPVALLALVALVSGHPFLSPVRQLVAVLPGEMAQLVSTTTAESDWQGMRLAREVPRPLMPPPPAPEDEPPAVEDTAVPPDDKIPRVIDPLRWGVALGATGVGLVLPLFHRLPARRTARLRPLRILISRGLFVSRSVTLAGHRAIALGAMTGMTIEQFLTNPAGNLLSCVLLPFSRIPKPTPSRTQMVGLVLFAAILIFSFVLATSWYGGILPHPSVLKLPPEITSWRGAK